MTVSVCFASFFSLVSVSVRTSFFCENLCYKVWADRPDLVGQTCTSTHGNEKKIIKNWGTYALVAKRLRKLGAGGVPLPLSSPPRPHYPFPPPCYAIPYMAMEALPSPFPLTYARRARLCQVVARQPTVTSELGELFRVAPQYRTFRLRSSAVKNDEVREVGSAYT